MALWTDGRAHVVATSRGIGRIEGETEEIFVFSRKGMRRDEDPPELLFFVVIDEEGRRALLRREGERCQLWSAGAGALEPVGGPEVFDAVSLAGEELLVAVAEPGQDGRERLGLRRARIRGAALELGEGVALPEAPRAVWKTGLFEEGGVRWPEEDPDADEEEPFDAAALGVRTRSGHWPGRLRLVRNRRGIAVASTYSGIVAVLDPATLAARSCARVPTEQEQFDVYALPAPGGVLVTLVANYRHTEYVFIADGGEVVAHRHRLGKDLACGAVSAGVLWSDDRALVNHQGGEDRVYGLSLPDLAARRFKDAGDRLALEAVVAEDGETAVVAYASSGYRRPQYWQLMRYQVGAARLRGVELAMPDFQPAQAPLVVSAAPRAEGEPILGLASNPASPWSAEVGAEAPLLLTVENRGGRARGFYVELAGDAITGGLVSGIEASATGAGAVELSRQGSAFRGELPGAEIDAGFADPKAAKGIGHPSLELSIRVRGEAAGAALMTVRVGPLDTTGTRGSALQGRSFTVLGKKGAPAA